MNKKSKLKLIKELHAYYVTLSQNGPLNAKLTAQDEQLLLHKIDKIEGLIEAPIETDVTILLSDLRGFTAMSEHYSPLEIIDLLNRYFTAMTDVIERYNGTIDKFMGDSIMVVFGSPVKAEDDLERTLACAIDMQIRLAELNKENNRLGYPPLYMGIGINTGQVVAGKLGSEIYSEFTVIGDNVNLASRVESYSLRGQILISEHTYDQVKDWVEVGQTNTLSVKGKRDPIRLYELVAINRHYTLTVPSREDRKSPRVEVNMPLKFSQISGKAVGEENFTGKIIDLSYGGMYIESEHEFPALTEIRFPLSLSLSANLSLYVYAKIIRINPRPENFHYHLEFSSIPQEAETALKKYIDRIISNE